MDELRNFFNHPCPSAAQVQHIPGGITSGMRITKEDTIETYSRKGDHQHSIVPNQDTSYAEEARMKENELYSQMRYKFKAGQYESTCGLESLEQLSTFGSQIENLNEETTTKIYSKYSFKKTESTKLPIDRYQKEILDKLDKNSVLIIEGPTGCGKTTQVPQWILVDSYNRGKHCKIIVTQPRRIAAISIANRVAQERGWDVGGLVGYQIGLDSKISEDTLISYVTTGILLQKLVAAKTMNEYTHIILDEVHERGQEMDFLLLVVRRLLYTISPKLKIILMSATFKKREFVEYFDVPLSLDIHIVSCVEVEKKDTPFTVKVFYLNNLTKFGSILQSAIPKDDAGIAPEMHHLVIKLINAFELIDKQEEKYEDRSVADLPSVLVFLPGINEIEDLYMCLNDLNLREKLADAECKTYKWLVLPLHSTITAGEQARVFKSAPPGQRKIILATNIAESSITVPDIKYVIDYCLIKELVADPNTNFTTLQLSWASKTNCEQRAGRAGRVRDGRVYRLVTDRFYENFKQACRPEILRCPLERLVLLAKMLNIGPPKDTLALAMDPPNLTNIERTILVLKEIGALKKTLDDEWVDADGDITYLGRMMAKLPLDVCASKLIILGHIYGCLEECIIMAAAMSVKNIFSSPFRERLHAYNSKLTWADGSTSDCIAFYNAYKVWNHLRQQQHFKQNRSGEIEWAQRFYVQTRALRELDDLVRELKSRLSREGIEVQEASSPWSHDERTLALKMVLAGATYPQYFIQLNQDESREREAVRTLGGNDPRHTVYLKDFPSNQPGEIYAAAIKKAVVRQIVDEPRVTCDRISQKVYLTFGDSQSHNPREYNSRNDPTIPGQVVLPVYKAVKARQLKLDIRIPMLPVERANELAKRLEKDKSDIDINKLVPKLPDVDDTHFPLVIADFTNITPSSFWVHYNDQSTADELRQIQAILQMGPLLTHTGPVVVGDVYVGPFAERQQSKASMHRVRVLRVLPRSMVEVLYIDYGTGGTMNTCNLRVLPTGICRDAPPLAMRCALAELAPSPLLDSHAHWSKQALDFFRQMTSKKNIIAKVYSVTHGTVSVELLLDNGRISINKELIKRGYAVAAEESYDSKLNHDLRETATVLSAVQKRAFNRDQIEAAYKQMQEAYAPDAKHYCGDVLLKGPYSPLESVLHAMMYASREKQINIEWNSVNSVLLDTDPQALHERLLIAAEVGQNESNSKLTLRHTTLMPNIPGLPAIVALLFCPSAELRRSSDGTRYVSALCGLGSQDDGMPYFSEHDLLVNIDATFTVADIAKINHVRHLTDYVMYNNSDPDQAQIHFNNDVPKTIRQAIIEILTVRRKHHELEVVPRAWEWRSVPENDLLEITGQEFMMCEVIYPLHSPQELRELTVEEILALKKGNDELKVLVSRTSSSSAAEVACKLCNTRAMSTQAMRIHLYSNAHKEKEESFARYEV